MSCVIVYKTGTATLNTDLKVSLSADNGNFTEVTLTATNTIATNHISNINKVTVTAGTQLKYKVEFATVGSKDTRIQGISMIF